LHSPSETSIRDYCAEADGEARERKRDLILLDRTRPHTGQGEHKAAAGVFRADMVTTRLPHPRLASLSVFHKRLIIKWCP